MTNVLVGLIFVAPRAAAFEITLTGRRWRCRCRSRPRRITWISRCFPGATQPDVLSPRATRAVVQKALTVDCSPRPTSATTATRRSWTRRVRHACARPGPARDDGGFGSSCRSSTRARTGFILTGWTRTLGALQPDLGRELARRRLLPLHRQRSERRRNAAGGPAALRGCPTVRWDRPAVPPNHACDAKFPKEATEAVRLQ